MIVEVKCVMRVMCVMCGTVHTLIVPAAGYKMWATGQRKIQHALPMLTPGERELLISGICPNCWDRMYGGNDA